MRRLRSKPVPRTAATALILFAQLQLLWLAAVHCHELQLVPLSAKLQPINPTQPASASAEIHCPACNLIHQSTTLVWPEFSARQPRVSARYMLATLLVRPQSCDMPVSRGRAPPLS